MESTIWFPVLILLLIIGLIAGLMVYQHAVLYSLAVQTAERAAYSWDNSFKEARSGAVDPGRRDGLYWRLTSDGAVPFLAGGAGQPIVYPFPDRRDDGRELSLPERKISRHVHMLPGSIHGQVSYENRVAEKLVKASFIKPLRLPFWLQTMFGNEARVEARAAVPDPVEYLRGIDLIRTYTGIAEANFTPEEARSLFKEPLPDGQPANVNSHTEAARWVRLQTGGRQSSFATSSGVRMIDSLTADRSAHQAYYTYRERQIQEQADKDGELLREGVVNKVVWHFFLGEHNRNPHPSQSLLDYIAALGIRVEIHPGGEN